MQIQSGPRNEKGSLYAVAARESGGFWGGTQHFENIEDAEYTIAQLRISSDEVAVMDSKSESLPVWVIGSHVSLTRDRAIKFAASNWPNEALKKIEANIDKFKA
jgi:hypothetical protein